MVGWAMNASHKKKDIPAHRVVNRNGMLTGKNHFESPSQMKCLLEKEGLEIQHDQVVDFNFFFLGPFNRIRYILIDSITFSSNY